MFFICNIFYSSLFLYLNKFATKFWTQYTMSHLPAKNSLSVCLSGVLIFQGDKRRSNILLFL
jgi:hypothetical protein